MKLLVVSHACASPVNLRFYSELQRQTQWDITFTIPRNWKDEYGRILDASQGGMFDGSKVLVPVRLSGDIILHSYRTSFARQIRQLKPDAIYVNHEPYALATAQVYFANRRTLRRPIGFYSCQNIVKRYPPPFCWMESMVFRQSSFAFPVSDKVKDVLRHKGYAGPAPVLPLGLDPTVYCPRDQIALREKLRGGDHQVLFGYVGRIVPEKGLLTLVRALALIRDLPWRLVVVGTGPLEAELDTLAASLGLADRVKRVGFIPHEQTPDYLSALDVLVVPSETQPNWKEQFGRVVIEAMACGTPVVGSDSGEIPKLIADTGGGLVFKERDAEDLARQLSLLARDPARRARLAGSGRAAVEQRYTLPAIVRCFSETIAAAVRPSQ